MCIDLRVWWSVSVSVLMMLVSDNAHHPTCTSAVLSTWVWSEVRVRWFGGGAVCLRKGVVGLLLMMMLFIVQKHRLCCVFDELHVHVVVVEIRPVLMDFHVLCTANRLDRPPFWLELSGEQKLRRLIDVHRKLMSRQSVC